jgi:hypothetical protein
MRVCQSVCVCVRAYTLCQVARMCSSACVCNTSQPLNTCLVGSERGGCRSQGCIADVCRHELPALLRCC